MSHFQPTHSVSVPAAALSSRPSKGPFAKLSATQTSKQCLKPADASNLQDFFSAIRRNDKLRLESMFGETPPNLNFSSQFSSNFSNPSNPSNSSNSSMLLSSSPRLTTVSPTKSKSKRRAIITSWLLATDPVTGMCAIHVASAHMKPDLYEIYTTLVRTFMAAGGSVNVKDGESHWTPLHHALYHANLVNARYLVSKGANLRALDVAKQTPLDLLPKVEFGSNEHCQDEEVETNREEVETNREEVECDSEPEFRRENQANKVSKQSPLTTNEVFGIGMNESFQMGSLSFDSAASSQAKRLAIVCESGKKGVSSPFIVDMASGNQHSLYLDNVGRLYSVGVGTGGCLFHGDEKIHTEATLVSFFANKPVRKLYAFHKRSAVITRKGDLYLGGYQSLVPTKVPHTEAVVDVALGLNFTLLLDVRGDLYGLGGNEAGQLAMHSSTKECERPRKITRIDHIVARVFSSGAPSGYSAVITQTGSLVVWGGSSGDTDSSSIPRRLHLARWSDCGDVKVFKESKAIATNVAIGEAFVLIQSQHHEVFVWTGSPDYKARCLINMKAKHISAYRNRILITDLTGSILEFQSLEQLLSNKPSSLVSNIRGALKVSVGKNYALVLVQYPRPMLPDKRAVSLRELCERALIREYSLSNAWYYIDLIHDVYDSQLRSAFIANMAFALDLFIVIQLQDFLAVDNQVLVSLQNYLENGSRASSRRKVDISFTRKELVKRQKYLKKKLAGIGKLLEREPPLTRDELLKSRYEIAYKAELLAVEAKLSALDLEISESHLVLQETSLEPEPWLVIEEDPRDRVDLERFLSETRRPDRAAIESPISMSLGEHSQMLLSTSPIRLNRVDSLTETGSSSVSECHALEAPAAYVACDTGIGNPKLAGKEGKGSKFKAKQRITLQGTALFPSTPGSHNARSKVISSSPPNVPPKSSAPAWLSSPSTASLSSSPIGITENGGARIPLSLSEIIEQEQRAASKPIPVPARSFANYRVPPSKSSVDTSKAVSSGENSWNGWKTEKGASMGSNGKRAELRQIMGEQESVMKVSIAPAQKDSVWLQLEPIPRKHFAHIEIEERAMSELKRKYGYTEVRIASSSTSSASMR